MLTKITKQPIYNINRNKLFWNLYIVACMLTKVTKQPISNINRNQLLWNLYIVTFVISTLVHL